MKLRIKFSKYGNMIFVGHLDIMRYFQKAIRRAEIDITYSTGFSPHQIMSFAQPLGVGLYSNGEYFDIGVDSITSAKETLDALQAQMVEGVDILSVRLLPENAVNAMASIAAADYTIRFRKGYEPKFDLFGQLDTFIQSTEVMVTKETKKSVKEFNLKDSIYSFSYDSQKQEIYMRLNASSSGNIKPTFVMNAVYEMLGQTLGEFDLLVTREDIYYVEGHDPNTEDLISTGQNETILFKSLADAGDDY